MRFEHIDFFEDDGQPFFCTDYHKSANCKKHFKN
jgi:hypothetical protein